MKVGQSVRLVYPTPQPKTKSTLGWFANWVALTISIPRESSMNYVEVESATQTFRSLNVFAAVNRTEMGKKTDESAGGTTNSIDPLPMFKWWKQNTLVLLIMISNTRLKAKGTSLLTNLRFELSMRSMDHSKIEFLESYLQGLKK